MNLAKSHTTLLTSNTWQDDVGQPWYNYDQQDQIPVGVRFNVRKLPDGRVSYWLKNEQGITNEYVEMKDSGCIYNLNFESSGVPAFFKGKAISSFDPLLYKEQNLAVTAVKRAKGYVKHFEALSKDGMGLFIYSKSVGSGKTHLVSAIANELMARYKKNIKFVKAVHFFSEMKRNISADKSDLCARSNLFETILQANLLIIDDLGAGSQSNYSSDLLYEMISKRVQYNQVTLFTSKRSFSELAYDNSTLNLIQQKSLSILLPNENVSKQIIEKSNRKHEQLLES